MIARIWTASATPEGARAYAEHFRTKVLPDLQAIAGHRGAYLLKRDDGDHVAIQVITLWTSFASVFMFAGPDFETAVVEPEAQAVLTSYSRTVTHHNVVVGE